MRLHNKIQVLNLLNHHIGVYPTPLNLNWNWSWGSLSGLVLASQIITGILLAMHYVGHVDHAFSSVQHLMVDVPSGVILRYTHANGASLFFTVVYLHVLRGLYYSSGNQPREIVWISGVVILLLMVITAFIGYVLPWGYFIGPKCIDISFCIVSIPHKNVFTRYNADLLSVSIGVLLGDAHCEKRGHARLTIKQSFKHKEWFLWLHNFYATHSLCNESVSSVVIDKKGYSSYKFNTYSDLLFTELHSLLYKEINNKKVKRVTKELLSYLTPIGIAAWVCDDGLSRNGSTAFCTDSFSTQCLKNIIEYFQQNYNIQLYAYKHENYDRLSVKREDMPKFALLIKKFLHKSMHYKLGDFKDI